MNDQKLKLSLKGIKLARHDSQLTGTTGFGGATTTKLFHSGEFENLFISPRTVNIVFQYRALN